MTRLYIAGTSREWKHDGSGRLQELLGPGGALTEIVCVLESFYYVKDWQTECNGLFRDFMLDSGAYTFCYGSKRSVELSSYLDRYANYVRDNGISLFFELDVDEIAGFDEVVAMRRRLESFVGRRCIPVWHDNRGHDEWLRMCKEYDYVAIGGIADRGRASLEPLVPQMVYEAHELGTKVHGLGYARRRSKLEEMGFDSVDSASWTHGTRHRYAFQWDGNGMAYLSTCKKCHVGKDVLQRFNFMEWAAASLDLEFGVGASDLIMPPIGTGMPIGGWRDMMGKLLT